MKPDDIVRYADRIYGYAIKRTFSRDEADELSQEILCAAIHSLPRLKDESRFEPWLWGIAANVSKAFRRGAGKRRAIYSYDALPELPYEPEDDNALRSGRHDRVSAFGKPEKTEKEVRTHD